jgi:capsular exopolysaccharide synthesis family protein
MNEAKEVSLEQLFKLLLKHKLLILIFTVMGLLISLGVTKLVMKEKYQSFVKLYVYSPSLGQSSSSADLNALNYAQKVVNTYIQMLDTRSFREEIRTVTGLNYTERQLDTMIEYSALNATEVFQATVTSNKPEDSLRIATAISSAAPAVISNIQESSNLKIVDEAVINNVPVSPNLRTNLAIGLVGGLAAAVFLIFMMDLFDNKVKSAVDLSELHSISVLAEVSDISKADRGKKGARTAPVTKEGEMYQIDKAYMEAYRTARTNLAFSVLKKGCKKIVITSSVSKEGKTTTSVNLAIALSQQIGVKVLLIDCDLRKPRLHQFFGFPSVPGVSDCLGGFNNLEEVMRQTHFPNLALITAGTIPPNPSELLSSNAFTTFAESLQNEFDYILFDTSPINIVVDAFSLLKICDGAVLTAVQGVSTHPEFEKTVGIVKNLGAKVVGAVLHGVESTRKKGYSGEYYYYY